MEIILRAEHLTKVIKSKTILDDVNVTLEKGKIYGLIGKKGAGKSTLLRIFSGLINPSSGNLTKNPNIRPAFVGEKPVFLSEKSIYENMKTRCILYNTPFSRIDSILEFVKLAEIGKKSAKLINADESKRFGIALSLLTEPEFVVIDEPFSGLKTETAVEFSELIKKIHTDYNSTILFSSCDLTENSQIADEFIFLHEGRIIEQITKSKLDKSVRKAVKFSVSDPDAALRILSVKLSIKKADIESGYVVVSEEMLNIKTISQTLIENAVRIYNTEHYCNSYEDYFLSLTQGDKNE
jgi:ABC-2 type transport system ATP-binding protein